MRKYKFTILLAIISLGIILHNYWGYDNKNIILIGLNPIINAVVYTEPIRSIIWKDGPTVYMYVFHWISFVVVGGWFDFLRYVASKK